ncbi:MAG: DUF4065 domain-containing protein [Synergistaceae bacterium]|nr:DUF4065 domain-containing protein [Synergistaceae bacterium]
MKDVYDFAKYFLKCEDATIANTYDGNMRLQKLLVLANLISIAEYNIPLFDDEILAFEHGCVVEKVRLRYKNDYAGFKKDSDSYQPDFSEDEYNVLRLTMNIFGRSKPRELSDVHHSFRFWKNAYENGLKQGGGFHDKSLSVVDMLSQNEDIETVRSLIDSFKRSAQDVEAREVINGITFHYDGFLLTDNMIKQLEKFSLSAEDTDYSVYLDNGSLVVY